MWAVCVLQLLALTLLGSGGGEMLLVMNNDVVSLPCGDVAQTNCSGTDWTLDTVSDVFYRDMSPVSWIRTWPSVDLVKSGVVNPDADRVNLTEACELQILKVSPEDTGFYTCTQHNQSQSTIQTGLLLSVVTVSYEANDPWSMIGSCTVQPFGTNCVYSVRWLVQDAEDVYFWNEGCSAHFKMSLNSPGFAPDRCEVRDLNNNLVQVFSLFNLTKPEWNQTLENFTRPWNQTSGEPHECDVPVTLTHLMLGMRCLELVVLSVIVALLLRACAGLARCRSSDHQQCITANKATILEQRSGAFIEPTLLTGIRRFWGVSLGVLSVLASTL
ncbi:uncharacterized protein LOC129411826 [Boleophthalmus pectinirostris]|uniref:uncharacterized protein LOC129411826 n=1 Tax=Boleophthalmus pectinirostris TaxID=150288 RepID=UPI00242B92A5|nr:uncharacterized protein LOC129411826 [Boleophthalmus pectinirostris]